MRNTTLCPWYRMDHYIATRNSTKIFTGHYQFSPREIITLTFAYSIVSILAVVGNSLVIWLIWKSDSLRKYVINHFLVNLAVADLIMGIFVVPIQIPLVGLSEWPSFLPLEGCPLMMFVRDLTTNVAVFTLVAIAFLRKRALTKPLRKQIIPPSRTYVKLLICLIWVAAVVLAAPASFACSVCHYFDMVTGEKKLHCDEWKVSMWDNIMYYFPQWVMQYPVPVCVISYLYLYSSRTLRSLPILAGSGSTNKKSCALVMVKATKIFCFCWFFIQFYRVLRIFNLPVNHLVYANVIWFSFNWLAMSNSCYNPFIYGICCKQFQDELKNLWLYNELGRIFERFYLKISHYYEKWMILDKLFDKLILFVPKLMPPDQETTSDVSNDKDDHPNYNNR